MAFWRTGQNLVAGIYPPGCKLGLNWGLAGCRLVADEINPRTVRLHDYAETRTGLSSAGTPPGCRETISASLFRGLGKLSSRNGDGAKGRVALWAGT